MTDVAIEYQRASALVAHSAVGNVLDLAAAGVGGATFFEGWVARPKVVAQLLLTVLQLPDRDSFAPLRPGCSTRF